MDKQPTYEELLEENRALKKRINELETNKNSDIMNSETRYFGTESTSFTLPSLPQDISKLTKEQVDRYSRQLLMHEIGANGTYLKFFISCMILLCYIY